MRSWRARGYLWIPRPSLHHQQTRHLYRNEGLKVLEGSQVGALQHPKNATPRLGKTIEVQGWIANTRKHGKITFADLRDGGPGFLQLVLNAEQASKLSVGIAITAKGILRQNRGNTCEVQVQEIETKGENDAETCPVQPRHYAPQFLRTVPHLRARHEAQALLLNLRSRMIHRFNDVMSGLSFIQVHTPIITSSDCEGAGEVFTVGTGAGSEGDKDDHFFKEPKYLTVSAQLHLEALASGLDRVWTLSPTFRAEKSDTARHLSEFYMLEMEMSFTNDINDIMTVLETSIRHVVTSITDHSHLRDSLLGRARTHADRLEYEQVSAEVLARRWAGIQKLNWPRVTYDDAIRTLESAQAQGQKFLNPVSWEKGLQADHEKFLAEKLGEGSPVFVTDYPKEQKPFYMSPTPGSEGRTVACFDLLVPDLCEIAGGSIREHRLEQLVEKMQEKGLIDPSVYKKTIDPGEEQKDALENSLDWYMDLRLYGSVPHGGYGLGFDRLLCYVAGVNNVRDMVAFPRWHGRCDA